jgi:hypothetical protein
MALQPEGEILLQGAALHEVFGQGGRRRGQRGGDHVQWWLNDALDRRRCRDEARAHCGVGDEVLLDGVVFCFFAKKTPSATLARREE